MARTIFDQVRSIIVEELDVDPDNVAMNARLRGRRLNADSLDLISLSMILATEFDVMISDEEVQKIVTIRDLVNYLEQ